MGKSFITFIYLFLIELAVLRQKKKNTCIWNALNEEESLMTHYRLRREFADFLNETSGNSRAGDSQGCGLPSAILSFCVDVHFHAQINIRTKNIKHPFIKTDKAFIVLQVGIH